MGKHSSRLGYFVGTPNGEIKDIRVDVCPSGAYRTSSYLSTCGSGANGKTIFAMDSVPSAGLRDRIQTFCLPGCPAQLSSERVACV